MNFYIGDPHFGHANVLKHDNRPFSSVDEMDRELIRYWNDTVTDKDDVYIVGDFAFRNERPTEWYLKQLKGKKHLIIGNHDDKLLKNEKAMSYFVSADKITRISDNGTQIVLCHYPIVEWSGFYHGAHHIYAHIHIQQNEAFNIMRRFEKAYNAGCMINGYRPVRLDELIKNNEIYKGLSS